MMQYNCYVKIELKNGYVLESNAIESHVTGIPCEADWTKADYSEWQIITASDKGKYIQIEGGKKGGVLSPKFYLPTATNINAYVAASGVGNKDRAMYVAVVDGGATSLVTSGSSMDTTYETSGAVTGTEYTTWTASSLSISNNQKISVAVYGGKFLGVAVYKGYLYKVKVEYK